MCSLIIQRERAHTTALITPGPCQDSKIASWVATLRWRGKAHETMEWVMGQSNELPKEEEGKTWLIPSQDAK